MTLFEQKVLQKSLKNNKGCCKQTWSVTVITENRDSQKGEQSYHRALPMKYWWNLSALYVSISVYL